MPLSENANEGASLHVEFTAIQTKCRELNLAVPVKSRDVFELVLQGLHALQESREARRLAAALKASRAKQLGKNNALKSHEKELLG